MKHLFKGIFSIAIACVVLCIPMMVKANSDDQVGLPYGINSMYVYKNGKKTNVHLHPNRYTKYDFSGNYNKPFVAKGKLPVLGQVTLFVRPSRFVFKDATSDQKDALGIDKILGIITHAGSDEPNSKHHQGYAYRVRSSKQVRKALLKMGSKDLRQFTDAHNSGDKSKLPNQNENLVTDWQSEGYNFTVSNIKLAPANSIKAGYMIDEDDFDSSDSSDSSSSNNQIPANTAYMDLSLRANTTRKVGQYDNFNDEDSEGSIGKEIDDGAREVMNKNMSDSEKANSSSIQGTGKTTTVHKQVTTFTLHYVLVNNQWQLNGVTFAAV